MGHYYSEMYFDHRSDREKKEDAARAKRKEEIIRILGTKLGIKKKDIKILQEILEESWNYN